MPKSRGVKDNGRSGNVKLEHPQSSAWNKRLRARDPAASITENNAKRLRIANAVAKAVAKAVADKDREHAQVIAQKDRELADKDCQLAQKDRELAQERQQRKDEGQRWQERGQRWQERGQRVQAAHRQQLGLVKRERDKLKQALTEAKRSENEAKSAHLNSLFKHAMEAQDRERRCQNRMKTYKHAIENDYQIPVVHLLTLEMLLGGKVALESLRRLVQKDPDAMNTKNASGQTAFDVVVAATRT